MLIFLPLMLSKPAIASPAPKCSLIVKRSSKACVGCSLQPSPAFITWAFERSATNFAAPLFWWRITKKSFCIASKFFIVSSRLSPFAALEIAGLRLVLSQPRRLAESSKLMRVLVEFSKNA